ncbi:prephenate dehydratase [Anaeromyxobacter oryzae]|uniref:Bifunctional chorismate mutase/prephenate dehydratase n=1 Tax=Anaeromyxobacter oryzae TaxID=2918170 RepID=A0ABM7X3H0_9BACT|nr:prephenate dehydratase [Anaeromyxobacter oryzae]BDG06307.1 prephenate dehydratase [Anaeromyxobacter oryzae]
MTTSGPPTAAPRTLVELRTLIDAIDERILALLNERARIAAEVGEHKRAAQPSAPFHVPAREREILARLEALAAGPFPREAIRPVFQEIMSACLSLERPLRVAFLGPEGAFSQQAVKYQFGLSAHALPQRSIAAVFHAVEGGQTDYGVVPVESATQGVVDPTLDAFLESELRVVAEILLPLELALLVHHDVDRAAVRRVYAQPELLRQCERWLSANLPQATPLVASSATEAARLAREDPEGAAIAPDVAARLFDLRIAAEGVQDAGGDATRFWVLGRKPSTRSGKDRTSLVVSVKDGPGVLLRVLEPLARRGVNLTRIESRPTGRRAWEYAFFLDLEGHETDEAVAAALADLRAVSAGVKLLGSYPRAEPLAR